MPSAKVPSRNISLGTCTCTPTAEYRPSEGNWVIRVSLNAPIPGEGHAFLPLFVHIKRSKRGFIADLESDQTDYTRSGVGWVIKRAFLRSLHFWTHEQ